MWTRRAFGVVAVLSLLCAGMATAAPVGEAAETRFSDVPAGAPFATAIGWLVDGRTTRGYPDGTFRPGEPITREAMAAFLHRIENDGADAPACGEDPFDDVTTASPFCGAVQWLAAERITGGYPDGTFRPSATITREAMAAFLYRAAHDGALAPACSADPFRDVPASSPFCGEIAWMVGQGIATGYGDGSFGPAGQVTRQAMAAFLYRAADPVHRPLGADVSYPQCGRALPEGQGFGIVGVNGGIATTTNPCLAPQLAWAADSAGWTAQDRVQLYVNTANPGAVEPRPASWPRSGDNRYGTCAGGNDLACAYRYGWERARDDATIRGVDRPQDHVWWLDVETMNTWDTGSAAGKARNVAVLEGMTEYFTSIGVRGVGLYSTAHQWGEITGGQVGSASSLAGLPSWLAGASSLSGAWKTCALPPLTPGGRVVLAQYVDGFDRNVACP